MIRRASSAALLLSAASAAATENLALRSTPPPRARDGRATRARRGRVAVAGEEFDDRGVDRPPPGRRQPAHRERVDLLVAEREVGAGALVGGRDQAGLERGREDLAQRDRIARLVAQLAPDRAHVRHPERPPEDGGFGQGRAGVVGEVRCAALDERPDARRDELARPRRERPRPVHASGAGGFAVGAHQFLDHVRDALGLRWIVATVAGVTGPPASGGASRPSRPGGTARPDSPDQPHPVHVGEQRASSVADAAPRAEAPWR